MRYIVATVIVAFVLSGSLEQGANGTPLHPQSFNQPQTEEGVDLEKYRLNGDVWPSHYDLEITPYFEPENDKEAFTFDGTTIITVTANESVRQINLHMERLNIKSWSVLRKNDSQKVRSSNETYDNETQILTLHLVDPLLKNVEYYINFDYTGQMEEDMRGFYRSYYKVSGKKVWLGSTQFEQMEARRAFPCFDEPKYKATFKLALNYRHLDYRVFSNTPPEISVNISNNRQLTTFKVTPKMSSYLLAFIVAPYELKDLGTMSVLARPEAANQTEYSLREGAKLLKQLGDWIEYPFDNVPEISRMYMAAVPDFAAGAMENWGLVTYRESSLLYAQEDATSLQQQRIATIISHELAHQWFGNLVTCEWWDVTWLNEGFATYLEYFGTALVEPDWELDKQFVVEKLQSAMQMDSSVATHPMTHPVYTPAQASAIFDGISYNKGGVVLRMLEHVLSSAVFKTVLREYVKAREFKTARPEDLFAVLDSHKLGASSFMKPWTTQPGFPLVTVLSKEEGFSISQKRFLVNGTDHNDKLLWPLPITYATNASEFANTSPRIVELESYNISLPNASDVPYFVLNNQQVGYYRVNYDTTLWKKISQALRSQNFGGIHVLNRAQIVDDLFNLARANVVGYRSALDILEYLKDETEYLPWLAAVNGLSTLSLRIHVDDEPLFSQHIMDIFEKVYDHVGFQASSYTERRVHTYLRRVVLDWTCRYGHELCLKSAVDEFERFRSNSSVKVHPNLRQVVYCEGIRRGSTEEFEFLLNVYLTTNVATEQQLALQGLSCASEPAVIHKFMNLTSSPDVRSQDKSAALSLLLANQYALGPATSYLVQNSERWAESHGGYGHVAQALRGILSRVKDPAVKRTIEEFTEANKETLGPVAYEVIKDGLVDFDSNQEFTLNHRDEIREFLKQKAGSGAAQGFIFHLASLALPLSLVALSVW